MSILKPNTDGRIPFYLVWWKCVRFVCLAMGWWGEACGGHLEGLELSETSSATNYSVSTLHSRHTKCVSALLVLVCVCIVAKIFLSRKDVGGVKLEKKENLEELMTDGDELSQKSKLRGLERKDPHYCYYSESELDVWKKYWREQRRDLIWGSVKEKPSG